MSFNLNPSQPCLSTIEESPSPTMLSTDPKSHLGEDYFRLRDFEYAQPLYDLACFLEADALAQDKEIPKYRTFSLWRAAYSFDGYSTALDKWLDQKINDDDLDYVPSNRIRSYLLAVRHSGTIPELQNYSTAEFERLRRLRAVKGLGLSQLAKSLREGAVPSEQWLNAAISSTQLPKDEILDIYQGAFGRWQSAHVVPPLVRLLKGFEADPISNQVCSIDTVVDGVSTISRPFLVVMSGVLSREKVDFVLATQPSFMLKTQDADAFIIRHQLGWFFRLQFASQEDEFDLAHWAMATDPFLQTHNTLKADLHLHTAWSDGNASLESTAVAIRNSGLSYFAVTDHSRSCKLQGGLTPVLWLRQAASIALNRLTCPILHGIEVDILTDGSLDLPSGLLSGMDIVVGSVHSNWANDEHTNTLRLIRAIETGLIDIIGHPTSAVVGKPGVPNYLRPQANVNWERVFAHCAKWRVALELNCFPSRLDLPLQMLSSALKSGCWISLGSDAHSRTHLTNLKFGQTILNNLRTDRVLNLLDFGEVNEWLREARKVRSLLPKTTIPHRQGDLFAEAALAPLRRQIKAYLNPPQRIPKGSRIIGFDLTAGKGKPTGVAVLDGMGVKTCSLGTDDELMEIIVTNKPAIVSIDSPLGFPGGGSEIDPSRGIVRVAEHDLSSVGIPAYPALIDSMKELTSRGVRLRRMIEALDYPPVVIESYPGAAQDVLCIPRKQKSLELLRCGLRELGILGPGLLTESHDEMDAITSAVVGRFYETGEFLPMGIPSEAQLIVPRIKPLRFASPPIICLAGKTGAGKTVVGRYLALFYGFRWVKTRDLIRQILVEDCALAPSLKVFQRPISPETITDQDLRDFGLLILEKYHQEPLRRKLREVIAHSNEPLVVDSIRDLTDLDPTYADRPIYIWFVDCSDPIINNRLAEKSKIPSFKGRPITNPIDQKVSLLHERSDRTISNMATLEDLRWRIDDELFDIVSFVNGIG